MEDPLPGEGTPVGLANRLGNPRRERSRITFGKRRLVKVLTVPEVAEYLHVSRVTIYRMLKQKSLPAFHVASQWRVRVDDLERWMRRREPGGYHRP